MRTHQARCSAITTGPLDFVDITDDVQAALAASAIGHGQVTVLVQNRSASLVVNEREAGFFSDVREAMERLRSVSAGDRKSLLGSGSVVLPAVGGRLHLGAWQRVLLVELEEPCRHDIVVQVVGE